MQIQRIAPGLWRWTALHPKNRSSSSGGPSGSINTTASGASYDALDRDVERAGRPVVVLTTVGWHLRSCDELAGRYAVALRRAELPRGVEGHRVRGPGELEVAASLRPLLDLSVERVLISVGEPVLERGRDALARALEA